MRPVWKGTIRFGLVTIPVGLVPARVDGKTSLRTLHRACSTPIELRAWCPRHKRVLGAGATVRGVELVPGQFVTLEEDELEAVAPAESRSIEIECLLEREQIEDARVERLYYLAPGETWLEHKPYLLLHRLLVEREEVAIARLVFRGSLWLVAIAPDPRRNLLQARKLAFSEDVVDPHPLEERLAGVELQDAELELGRQLAAKLARRKPGRRLFESEQRERMRNLVDAKIAGAAIVESEKEAPGPGEAEIVDLGEALRRSIRPQRQSRARVAR